MKLTEKQTDKILEKLNGSGFAIIDTEQGHNEQMDIFNISTISEEYFWEKVNEELEEEENKYEKAYNLLMEYWDSIPDEDKEELDKELTKLGC